MKSNITKALSIITLTAVFSTLFTGCSALTAAEGTGGTGGGTWLMVGYMALIFGVLYLFMIRPEKKRKKKLDDMRGNLSVGDQITTIGGVVGKIVHVKDEFIVIETSEDRVRIELAKWAISTTGKAATQDQK